MIKCQTCGESTIAFSERFEKMEVITKVSSKGRKRNLFYHKGDCWEKELARQEFANKEKESLDSLVKTIMRIHRRKAQIPDAHYQRINDLRNGTDRYRKFWRSKYKEGVPYNVIEEAYKLSKSSIDHARNLGRFKDTNHELAYSFKIVCGKVEDAYKKIERSVESEKILKATEKSEVRDIQDRKVVDYSKNKQKRMDLSDIFGDD